MHVPSDFNTTSPGIQLWDTFEQGLATEPQIDPPIDTEFCQSTKETSLLLHFPHR